jgi:hypothetical protein
MIGNDSGQILGWGFYNRQPADVLLMPATRFWDGLNLHDSPRLP